jgi:signal transduction histidine kinase
VAGQLEDLEARWTRTFHLIFYAGLAVPTALVLGDGDRPAGERLATGAIVLGMAGWHWLFIFRRPHLQERLKPMAAHLLVLTGFFVVLTRRDPVFVFLINGLLPQPYLLLPGRWAYLGAALLVTVLATVDGLLPAGHADVEAVLQFLGNLALVMVLGWFLNSIAQQSEQHRAMVEELTRTRADLAERSRQAGILEERGRLAREIHDTLAQGISGMVTQLEATEQALPHDLDRTRGHLATAKRLARDSLAEARRSVDALRPEPLEGAHLDGALAAVARQWSAASEVAATVTVTGAPRPLQPEVETALLRAAQEALANVARHAAASRVAVTLSYMDDQVTLDVVDDGRGFDPASDGGGYGLRAMRERAARLAGEVTVESAPGQGVALCVSIPALEAAW